MGGSHNFPSGVFPSSFWGPDEAAEGTFHHLHLGSVLAAIFYHLISGLDRTRRRLNLRNKQVLESILAQDPNKARIQGLPEQWLVTHLMVSRAYHLIVG